MRKSKVSFVAAFVLLWIVPLCGCNPGGVTTYEDGTMDGYTFLCPVGLPISQATMLRPALIDMQGNEVNRYGVLGPFGKILPGGSAIMGEDVVGFPIMETHSLVQETWEGAVEWTYSDWENHPRYGWTARMQRDIQREGNPVGYYAPEQDPLPEGNTLVLAHADETRPEISAGALLNDIIYEIDWAGTTLFYWNPLDHFDEFGFDEDAEAEIYDAGGDWLHATSMSRLGENRWYDGGDARFHPQNMIIGSANAGLIAIIDHQSGAVVWRVGPDYSPGMPGADLGPLINMHHAHMVPAGLPGEGNILVHDNGGSSGYGGPNGGLSKYTRDYSRVVEFSPQSLQIVWNYDPANGDPLPDSIAGTGGVQRLPNGNTLITSGMRGIVLEVTPDKQVVWEYLNSYASIFRLIYRAYRVPPEWLPVNPAGYTLWE